MVVKIILPHAAAMIFTGLRMGLAMGFIGVVIAELLITPTGIGDLITYHSSVADFPEMFAAVVFDHPDCRRDHPCARATRAQAVPPRYEDRDRVG